MVAQQTAAAIAKDKNFDRIAQKIDELNAQEIEIALNKGALYWQRRRSMSRDGFKIWLSQNGFTHAVAAKYITFVKEFANFSPQCIGKIALSTLFALCQPKYKKLVCKLHCCLDRGENPSSNAAGKRNPKGRKSATARCTENRTAVRSKWRKGFSVPPVTRR